MSTAGYPNPKHNSREVTHLQKCDICKTQQGDCIVGKDKYGAHILLVRQPQPAWRQRNACLVLLCLGIGPPSKAS